VSLPAYPQMLAVAHEPKAAPPEYSKIYKLLVDV
jgi:hypothetical protein